MMDLPANLFGDKKIKVVRHAGDLNKITLEDGTIVHRMEQIFVPNMGLIPCAPYDNHLLFRHEYKDKHGTAIRGWTLFCSCGSPAAVVGYEAYKKDASNSGQLMVCLHHAMYNRHADGST